MNWLVLATSYMCYNLGLVQIIPILNVTSLECLPYLYVMLTFIFTTTF